MVTNVLAGDFDHDGFTDILLLGNHTDNRLKLGSIDANYGCLLKGDGKGNFTYVPQPEAGLSVKGDVKDAAVITVGGTGFLAIGISDEEMQFYRLQ